MSKVVCIGCGTMGSRHVAAYMKNGHSVTIVNRTEAKAQPFVEKGASYVPDVSSLKGDADLVSINLTDYDIGLEMIKKNPEYFKGKTIVNLSTGEGTKVREFDETVRSFGGRFICGVITCYPRNIGPDKDGSLAFAGDRKAYEEVKDILASLSPENVFVGEDPTLATVTDVAWLAPHYGLYWGMIQGAAVCRDAGIDLMLYKDMVKVWIEALMDLVCDQIEHKIIPEKYGEGIEALVDVQVVALNEIVEDMENRGYDAGPLRGILEITKRTAAGGDGDKNFEAIIDYLKK